MRESSVITFYSYKGGVGRSFLLANVATLLTQWGYRVLVIDWDLEAPGLDCYFHKYLVAEVRSGLVDLIHAFKDGGDPKWRDYLTTVRFPGTTGQLDLISAGRQDDGFIERVQGLSWMTLYVEHEFGTFLEAMRADWKEEYDYVLLDSRTGITDIGGICTVQLPDILVLVFVANHQNVDGIELVAERALAQRQVSPLDRARLQLLPILSRFEPQVEYERSKRWVDTCAERFADLYDSWISEGSAVVDLLNQTKILSVPYWSYGEELPVLTETKPSASDVSYFITSLAALLGRRLADVHEFLGNRDGYVAAARKPGSATVGITHDLYLSFSAKDQAYARELSRALEELGLSVLSSAEVAVTEEAGDHIRRSRHFVAVLGATVSEFQAREAGRAAQQAVEELALDTSNPRRLVFVVLPGAAKQVQLEHWTPFQRIQAEGNDVARVARDVAVALGHFDQEREPDEDYY